MWNFVSSIQATLDEAAGIDTRGAAAANPQQPTNDASKAVAASGWEQEGDDFDLDLDYGDEVEAANPNGLDVDEDSLIVPTAEVDTAPSPPILVSEVFEEQPPGTVNVEVDGTTLKTESDVKTAHADMDEEPPFEVDAHEEATDLEGKPNIEETYKRGDSHDPDQLPSVGGLGDEVLQVAGAVDATLLPQLLRLQAQLAEEANHRAAAEDKLRRLKGQAEEKLRLIQQQHTAALAAAKKGTAHTEVAVAALQQEGQAMSRQLGEERSRVKDLQQALKECEKGNESLRVALAKKDEELATTQRTLKEQMSQSKAARNELSSMTNAASQGAEELAELQAQNEELREAIEVLKAAATDEINEAGAKEQELTANFEQQREALMAEVEGLRHQLRRVALDHERALVAMEKEVAAANERAYGADVRAMEAARSSTDSTREMSAELIILSDRANKLQDQLRERSQQLGATQTQMREERDTMLAAHRAEVEGLKGQLQVYTSHQSDAVLKLQVATEEMRREREQWRKRELGLTESIQELRAAVRASAASPIKPPPSSVDTLGGVFGLDSSASMSLKSLIPTVATPQQHQHQPTNRLVERELARVSTDLAALQAEHHSLVQANAALTKQHEVLLEMYGEKEEELAIMIEERSGGGANVVAGISSEQ